MNIYQSIAKIMEEVPAISKNKKNTQQGFMYRGIDEVMNAFQPLFAKYKVFIVPQILELKREERTSTKGNLLIYSICTIQYTFYAEDGSCIQATVIGEGMDSGDKATNKAMAIALKYALFQVFCIPTEDDPDQDGSSDNLQYSANKTIDNTKIEALKKAVQNKGLTEEQLVKGLAHWNYKNLAEIKEKDYMEIYQKICA